METKLNYYEILGLSESATSEEIKNAYRQLAKKYHPDINDAQNANTFFRLINEAYTVLSDTGKRAAYDNKSEPIYQEVDFDIYTPVKKPITFLSIIIFIFKFLLKIIILPIIPVLAVINIFILIAGELVKYVMGFLFLADTLFFFIVVSDIFTKEGMNWHIFWISIILGIFILIITGIVVFTPKLIFEINAKLIEFLLGR